MTFLEHLGIVMKTERNVNNVGMALNTVLQKAKEEGRLICGVYECVQILQNVPEVVALCLLPEVASTVDVAAHIQHKLMEAFCLENDIEVVTVDSLNLIANEKSGEISNFGCILIRNERSDDSVDEFISNYLRMLANQLSHVELPE